MSRRIALVEGGAADLDEVMETMTLAFNPAFGEAWTRPQCAGILGLDRVWLMLARADGVAAGFSLSRVACDEAELLLLAVRPTCRRRGIGRALLEGVAMRGRLCGVARLHLEMREGNPAQALYAGCGFVEVGRRPRYYRGPGGHAFDAITWSRPLHPSLEIAAS